MVLGKVKRSNQFNKLGSPPKGPSGLGKDGYDTIKF
jgi:hypothetical protein